MKADNQIVLDSKAFAIRIIKLYKYLSEEKKRVCDIEADSTKRHKYWSKYQRKHICTKPNGFCQ